MPTDDSEEPSIHDLTRHDAETAVLGVSRRLARICVVVSPVGPPELIMARRWRDSPSRGTCRNCDCGPLQQTATVTFAVSDAAGLVGPHGDLDAVSGAELSHEAGEVGFDGAWGDVELAGDLIVGAALGYRHEDFLLAGGERFYRLPRW